MHGRGTTAGLTLLELVIALAIASISLAIAVPGYAHLVEVTRHRSAAHELTTALMLARSAAITRRMPVSVCPIADQPLCTGGHDWDRGWMIFLDPQRVGQPAGPDAVLRRFERVPHAGLPTVRTTPGRLRVRFQPSGMAGGSNLSLSICSRRSGRLMGTVVVNRIGRARGTRAPVNPPEPCPYTP